MNPIVFVSFMSDGVIEGFTESGISEIGKDIWFFKVKNEVKLFQVKRRAWAKAQRNKNTENIVRIGDEWKKSNLSSSHERLWTLFCIL